MSACRCDVCVALAGLAPVVTGGDYQLEDMARQLPRSVQVVLAAQQAVLDGTATDEAIQIVRHAAARCTASRFVDVETVQ